MHSQWSLLLQSCACTSLHCSTPIIIYDIICSWCNFRNSRLHPRSLWPGSSAHCMASVVIPKPQAATSTGISSSSNASQVKPKVLIITGPTGAGKTETSLLLAERLDGEIISADSVQVYRGLDVGSDKLPLNERRGTCLLAPPCCCCSDVMQCGRNAAAHCEARSAVSFTPHSGLRQPRHGRSVSMPSQRQACALDQ
jgi:hypothetical protein